MIVLTVALMLCTCLLKQVRTQNSLESHWRRRKTLGQGTGRSTPKRSCFCPIVSEFLWTPSRVFITHPLMAEGRLLCRP